ncbi:YcxB family protein [Kribbella sp. NPDC050124]|uniref:YcxB family protein n=1 Tax=Kribbella sp. NPDC050124 TaxID=3364114 RepID=UPI003799DB18
MNIVVPVELTFERRLRNTRVQLRWFAWLLRAAGLVFLAMAVADSPIDLGSVILAMFYLFMPELLGIIRHLLGRRYGSTYTYTFTEEQIAIRTAITNLELPWSAVKSVRQRGHVWTIRLPGAGGFAILKDDLTPEQAEEWQAFLARRAPARA